MLSVPGVFFFLIFLMISCILYNVASSISLLINHSHKIQMAVFFPSLKYSFYMFSIPFLLVNTDLSRALIFLFLGL